MSGQPSGLIIEEIKCYGLPYGLLGFISHMLTDYTIIAILCGREPLRPWNRTTGSTFGFAMAVLSFASNAIALRTIIECRSHWQLVLTGIWKFCLSLTNSAVALSSAWSFWRRGRVNRNPHSRTESDKPWWHYRRLATLAVGDSHAQDAVWE